MYNNLVIYQNKSVEFHIILRNENYPKIIICIPTMNYDCNVLGL